MKRLAMLLALSALACGGRDDCKEARVAAEQEVGAAVALVEVQRDSAARELVTQRAWPAGSGMLHT